MNRPQIPTHQVTAGQTTVVGPSYRLADGSAQLVTTRGPPTEAAAPGPAA